MRHRPSPARLLAALLVITLASCVGPPRRPAPVPAPPPAPIPAPAPLASDWRDWPVTPGTWRYDPDAAGSRAAYGGPGQDYVAAFTCDRGARRLILSLPGAGEGPLTVRTTSATRTLPAQARPHADAMPPWTVEARLDAADPLLDAIAFSRGRFVVSRPGAAPLVLSAWAEIGRVIEDCRG